MLTIDKNFRRLKVTKMKMETGKIFNDEVISQKRYSKDIQLGSKYT